MRKIIFFIFIFTVLPYSFCFADSVTLTTYYPAPFGMYQEMRVMGKLGVGTTNPTYPLQVGDLGAATAPIGSSPAMAIQNDLWVNGNIYGISFYGDGSNLTGIGGWTRDSVNNVVYTTNPDDTVGIGISAPSGSYTSRLEIFNKTNGSYGIFQGEAGGVNSTNFFGGSVGIGTAISNPSAAGSPSLLVTASRGGFETANQNILVVGNRPDRALPRVSANLSVYGTLGVSAVSAFADRIKALKGVQLGTHSASTVGTCTDNLHGVLQYRIDTAQNPDQAYLEICTRNTLGNPAWRVLHQWEVSGTGPTPPGGGSGPD